MRFYPFLFCCSLNAVYYLIFIVKSQAVFKIPCKKYPSPKAGDDQKFSENSLTLDALYDKIIAQYRFFGDLEVFL
jgi:hypothetical protein